MKCLRCGRDSAAKIADAPDGSGAWEVYYCKTCNYSWRNTDPPCITDPAQRDPWGQLDAPDALDRITARSYSAMTKPARQDN